MPLFNYKCSKCEIIIEKFLHKATDEIELTCECGNSNFARVFGDIRNRTYLNAKDLLNNKINPDIERIRNNINKGKDRDFLDIYGEK